MPHIRQGDVYVIPVEDIPEDAIALERDAGRVVLAYGEVTGHAHAIAAEGATLLRTTEGERFLRIVGAPAPLIHEEHATLEVAPGTYRIVTQREWTDDQAARPVLD